jgi:hypothetical protein
MATVGRQIMAMNVHPNTVMYCKSNPFRMHLVKAFMEAAGFQDVHPFFWYKPTLQQRGLQKYSHAVEVGVIGYKGGRVNCRFNNHGLWSNPIHRQNIVMAKGVSGYYKDDSGISVNSTESPPQLAKAFAEQHTLTDEWALVIGGGSGADAIGCLAAGCNVVVLDREKSMVDGMTQRFNELSVGSLNVPSVLPLAFVCKMGEQLLAQTKMTKEEGLQVQTKEAQLAISKISAEDRDKLESLKQIKPPASSSSAKKKPKGSPKSKKDHKGKGK